MEQISCNSHILLVEIQNLHLRKITSPCKCGNFTCGHFHSYEKSHSLERKSGSLVKKADFTCFHLQWFVSTSFHNDNFTVQIEFICENEARSLIHTCLFSLFEWKIFNSYVKLWFSHVEIAIIFCKGWFKSQKSGYGWSIFNSNLVNNFVRWVFVYLGEYHPPPSPPTPGKEEGVPARRGSDGKLRGRKRVSDPAPPLDSDIEVNTHTYTVLNIDSIYLSPSASHKHTHTHNLMRLTLHLCYFIAAGVYLGPGWNHHHFPFAPHGNLLLAIWQGTAIWPLPLSLTARGMCCRSPHFDKRWLQDTWAQFGTGPSRQ